MVKIIKPRTLGILTRTQPRGKGALFIVSVYGLFDVGAPGILLSDQALWPTILKELPEGSIFDPGMPKPQGEVLVAGRAMAPGGVAVPGLVLTVALGPVAKRVAVFGDRRWEAGYAGYVASAPRPFTEMQIDLRRMFGGPGHPLNTIGTGYHALGTVQRGELCYLPNFEDPQRLIQAIDDAPNPPGLLPIDLASRDRLKYAGTYDRLWQETLAPGLPIDADPRIHCVAPEDQRILGYFAGDEAIYVAGMTPDAAGYRGALPAVRARAFVQRTSEPAGFVELAMQLDTVLLLGSLAKGVVVFRGALAVADIDAKDAAALMIAYERMADEPQPIEHYAEVFRLRTDKKEAKKYVFADYQLTPTVDEATLQRRRRAREVHALAQAELFADGAHLVMRRQFAESGLPASLAPARPKPVPLPVLLPTPEEFESGDVDLAEVFDGIDRETAKAREKLDALQAAADAAIQPGGGLKLDQLITDVDAILGTSVAPDIKQGLEQAQGGLPSIDQLLAELGDRPQLDADRLAGVLDQTRKVLAGEVLPPTVADDEEAFAEARAIFLGLPDAGIMGQMRRGIDGLLDRVASTEQPTRTSEPEPASNLVAHLHGKGEGADQRMAEKAAAIDEQLRVQFPGLAEKPGPALATLLDELSGMAPGGASSQDVATKLGDARAKLDDAETMLQEGMGKLRRLAVQPTFPQKPLSAAAAKRFGAFVFEQWRHGLDLRGRDLAGADLSGRNLSGADLTGAFLEGVDLNGAVLDDAICKDAVFAGAKLDGARFDGAELNGANLSRASARGTSFKRADLENIRAIEAAFPGADFGGAHFAGTSFIKTNFTGARLAATTLKKLTFLQCPFDHVLADSATFERCQMLDFSARNSSFRGARLIRTQMLKMVAPQADFTQAVLDGSSFAGGAKLEAARFDGASLVGTTLQGADLTGASFVRARLDRAVLGDAKITDSDFTCASLKRALLGAADLSRSILFGANLFEAMLRRTNLTGADLRSANLYSADLFGAEIAGADLSRANCAKTRLALETSHAA
jgi:uncharacterized protein YjbI with pentapeptide repeats